MINEDKVTIISSSNLNQYQSSTEFAQNVYSQSATKQEANTGKLITFKGDEAVNHFEKHGKEIMSQLNKNSYNLKDYVEDANYILENGQYVPELNGYAKLIGGKGSAKYGFVGLDRTTGQITTFHLKTVGELARKTSSLGLAK